MTPAKKLIDDASQAARDSIKSWEDHGSNIAGSRWLEGRIAVAVEDRRQVWKCPTVGCSGHMYFTGEVWCTGDPGYHHQCDVCGFKAAIKGAKFLSAEADID